MKSARSAVRSVLSALILTLVVPAVADASHFRGGSISATVAANGTVTVTLDSLWRKNAVSPLGSIQLLSAAQFANPALIPQTLQSIICTNVATDTSNPFYTSVRETCTFSLSARGHGTYFVRATSCCRIAGIRNAPESTWAMHAKIVYNGTPNGSPLLDSQVITAVARGFLYSQNLNAVDAQQDPLSYEFLVGAVSPNFAPTTQVPGLQIDSTGQMTISAASTANLLDNTASATVSPGGDYAFRVRVTDSKGAFSERDALLDAVTTTNQLPVLAGIGNRTVKVGETLTFGVSATDPDAAQIVTLRTSTLPANATFTKTNGNPATGTFTFTPTAAQIGPITINFEAADNDAIAQLVDSEPVIITVIGNNKAPVLGTVGSRQASVGVPLQFFLTATDPNPSDTLTFSGSFLPAGAAVDATSGLFSWTPAAGQANTVINNIVLSVTDNGAPVLTDTEAISITVGSANRSPSLGPLPDYIFSSPGVPLQMAVLGSDPDAANSVTLAVNGVPAGGTFTETPGNPASGLFSWTPAANQGGVFAVTCSATDNGSPNLQDRFTTTYVIAAPGGTPSSVCVSPNAGKLAGGTFVTVRGTGFVTGMTVMLNGLPVLSPTVVNASTLTFFTPAGVNPGPVNLMVQTTAGTETLTGAFVYHNGTDRPVERLIAVVGPDLNGNVTIRGAIGAVAANANVEFTFPASPPVVQSTIAAPDGSFTLIVPTSLAQTSFLVRASDAAGLSPITVVNAATPSIAAALVTSAPSGTPGQTRITGAAGAVPARGELVVILADGTALTTTAGFDGGFSVLVPTASARTGVILNAANCVGAVVARMTFVSANSAPEANAGPAQTVPGQSGGVQVTLDGSLSSDPDGGALTYLWSSPSNSSVGTTAQVNVTLSPGVHVFTLVVTDPDGDSDSASVTITVTDTTPPVVTAPANITAEATSAAGAVVTYSGESATDLVDGSVATSCSPASGSTFPIGANTVTCSATDVASNTGTATFTITVQDTTAPVVTAPGNKTAEATSAAGAVVTYSGESATDLVDGSVTTSCSPASGSTFALGANTVTCSATDARNNTGTATFTITVQDTTAPVVTAPGNQTAEATGPTGAVVTYSGESASDLVDGPVTTTCSPASGSTFALGANTVTCSATDAASNTGTATFTITVVDTTPPAITAPANKTAEATGANGAVVTYSGESASDLVDGTVATSCSPASGSTFALGLHTVTCSATDARNNTGSATFTITVVDTTPPAVTAPASKTAEATGASGAVVTYSGESATDLVDGAVAASCSPASGSTFALGANTVTCTATDARGNAGTASFTITVQDTTPPAVTAPANKTAEATSATGAIVTYSGESATDLVDGAVATSCSPISGSVFAVGATQVTCTATDARGNAGTATFTITVEDKTPPVVTAPVSKTAEATSANGAVVTYSGESATDLVDGSVTTTCSPASGSVFALGTNTVTCTATDAHGNAGTASFTITVEDKTAPAVTAPANKTAEATGATGAVVTYSGESATDLVDGAVATSCSPASGSVFAIGANTVTCTATDARGNIGTATFTVTVEDKTIPVVIAPANTTAEATGPNGAVVTYSGQSASDLVDGPVATSCSPASGSAFAVGATQVNCTATDAHGNIGAAAFTITVVDTKPPVVTAPASKTAEATSANGAVVTYSGESAADLVDGAVTTTCSPASGSVFAIGANTVTCTATDAHGNAGTASFTITVEDKTAPAVTAPANKTAEATGASGAVVTYSGESATDLVDGAVPTSCSASSGSVFGIGANTVTCTATDARGNTGTATFTITVQDTTAPTLSLPAPIVTTATGASGAPVTFSTSATDVVAGSTSVTCSPASGSVFAVGTTTVTCSSTDGHSNTRTGTFTVTVNPTGAVTVGPGQTVTFSGGTVGNNLNVNGGTLILTNGSSVSGNLTVTNGSISVTNSTLGGNVNFSGTGTFTLGPGTVVTGQLNLSALPAGSGVNSVCGARIDKNVTLDDNAAPVTLGNPSAGCAGNVIDGQVFIVNNSAPVQVFGNTISNKLQCSGNTAITGGGNTASQKQGQCSPF